MIKANSQSEDPSLVLMRQMLKEDGFDEATIELQMSQFKPQNQQQHQPCVIPKSHNIPDPKLKPKENKPKEESCQGLLWEFTDEQILDHVLQRFGKEALAILSLYKSNKEDRKQKRDENRKKEEEEKRDIELLKGFYKEEKELQDRLERQKDCPICIENLLTKDFLPLKHCVHVYHIECLETQVIQNIKDRRFPVICPIPSCRREISFGDIMNSLQKRPDMQHDYYHYSLKFCLDSNPDEFLNCATPDCEYAFVFDPAGGPRFDCPKCKKSYCVPCKTNWHVGLKCEGYKAQREAQSDDVFFKFANQKNFKKCPKCQFWIEKSEGCNHMQCSRCQTQFCYRCGRKRDGSCTCD